MKSKYKTTPRSLKTLNLSSLDGVYDVQVNKAAPAARRQRDASENGKAVAAQVAQSQDTDDARARAIEHGFDPNAKLPTGFFG